MMQCVERVNPFPDVSDLGLYIHIPFCKKRCHFCAFYLAIHREDLVCDFLERTGERDCPVWQ